jgi:hypothetical protein
MAGLESEKIKGTKVYPDGTFESMGRVCTDAGKLLKTGDHVDIVSGKARVDGLVVE